MIQRLLAVSFLFGLVLTGMPEEASAQFFGRNKVQYRTFDFKIIETRHFDLYYYEEEREAALDAARMADRAYARLSKILQHEFRERKPIILYASHADFQQTNTTPGFLPEGTGAFAEALKGRIVIPLTGSYASFDAVLRHELVHAFQFDIIFRNAAMDNANPFANRYPLWFMEGMAEYLAIGHIDPITNATLRDAALSGYLRTIGEMNRIDDYLSYRFGQALWAYIGSRWGDEVIGILLQRATRVGVPRAFEMTLGLTLQELSNEWVASVRRTYLPQVAEFQRAADIATPILHHESLFDPSYIAPAVSPDGKHLAVFSARDGFFPDLWLVDAESGEFIRRLIASSREADFESLRYSSSAADFSPDGRYLAFAAQTGGRDALYIYDLERNRVDKRLDFELNAIMAPSWSPDGRHIVFSGVDGGLSDLFITDLDGNLRRLTSDRHAALFPAWSPDGRSIAFSTDRGEETDFERLSYSELRVALFHLEDGTIEVLPEQEIGRNVSPAWSPDSRKLMWVSDRTGTKNLYLFDRDERRLSVVSDLLSGVMGPAATDLTPVLSWARETGQLFFNYFEAGGHSVYAIDDPLALPRLAVAELPTGPAHLPLASRDREAVEAVPVEPVEPVERADGVEPLAIAEPDTARPGAALSSSFYREGETFRPSARLPEGIALEESISVLALLDSADFALPDTAEFNFADYGVRFTPDIVGRPTIGAEVGGYYGNGVYGGSYVMLSDMLGNHNILLSGSVNGSFSDAMFYGGYNFLKRRTNYGIAVMQLPLYAYGGGRQYIDSNGDVLATDLFMRDLTRSVQGIVSYPFNTFQRVELGASAAFLKRDYIERGVNISRNQAVDRTDRFADANYFMPSAALVFDNSFFGWTGPIIGRRYRLQVSQSLGDFRYTEGLVDFRNYLNINRNIVFATRLLGLVRNGPDAEVVRNFWGGPYFLRGYDGGSYDLYSAECAEHRTQISDCPVRDQLIGSNVALLNAELRFPLISELRLGFLGNFPPVDAIAFFDGGLAWDNRICFGATGAFGTCEGALAQDVNLVWERRDDENPLFTREPLFSYGLGLRINVFYTVLRLDYAFPINRPDRSGRFTISFGPSF